MTQKEFLVSRYKNFKEAGFPVGDSYPAGFQPSVHRLFNGEIGTGSGDATPATPGYVGGTGILGAILYTDATNLQNLTLINSVVNFDGNLYAWFGNDIWTYPLKNENIGGPHANWTVAATPTTSVTTDGDRIGIYTTNISGIPYLVTGAIEGTTFKSIRFNANTQTWESGITIAGAIQSRTVEGSLTEVMYDKFVWFITAQNDEVYLFNTHSQNIQSYSWPRKVYHPMCLNVFQDRVYCLNKADDTVVVTGRGDTSGVFLWEMNKAVGPIKARTVDLDGRKTVGNLPVLSGLAPLSNNFVGRNCLFTSNNPNNGGEHMVALQHLQQNVVSPTDGWQIWRIFASGDGEIFASGENALKVETSRASILPFPLGGPMNLSPSLSIEDSLWVPFMDDVTNVGTQNTVETVVYRDHPNDGAFFREFQYNGTSDMTAVGTPIASGETFNAQNALSYGRSPYGGGHRIQVVGDIYAVISGVSFVESNSRTKIEYGLRNSADVPNGTSLAVRLMHGRIGGLPHTQIGSIFAANTGTITADFRHLITADSGILYSFEWDTLADGFVPADTINFVLQVSTTGTAP